MIPTRRIACRLRSATPAFFAAVLLLSPGSAPVLAISLEALRGDGYGVVPLRRPNPNSLTVPAEIDGQTRNLVVDTGWASEGLSLLTNYRGEAPGPTDQVKEFGKTATGASLGSVKKGMAAKVLVGNVQLSGVPLFFGNFQGLRHEQTRRSIGADGFLGAGFLRTCSAVLDLHNLRLYLRPPGIGRRVNLGPALRASGLAEVPFQMTLHNNCVVDVEINGVPGRMFLDTGAYLAGIDSRLAAKLKTAAYTSRMGTMDAAGVLGKTTVARLSSFKIGGVAARAPDIRMQSFGFYNATNGAMVGLLGMDILGQNGTIIDFSQQKLYFYPL